VGPVLLWTRAAQIRARIQKKISGSLRDSRQKIARLPRHKQLRALGWKPRRLKDVWVVFCSESSLA